MRPKRSPLEIDKSETLIVKSETLIVKSETFIVKSETFIVKSETLFAKSETLIVKIKCMHIPLVQIYYQCPFSKRDTQCFREEEELTWRDKVGEYGGGGGRGSRVGQTDLRYQEAEQRGVGGLQHSAGQDTHHLEAQLLLRSRVQ